MKLDVNELGLLPRPKPDGFRVRIEHAAQAGTHMSFIMSMSLLFPGLDIFPVGAVIILL